METTRKLSLTALTPDGTVMERTADFIVLRAAHGDMGVLPGHEPCAVMLNSGILRIFDGKKQTDALVVPGGFASVWDDKVVVLSEIAGSPDRIEALLAEMEIRRAEKQSREERAALEIHRAETALRRALVDMDISAYSILKGHDEQTGKEPDEER